jgi:hypothetical protein
MRGSVGSLYKSYGITSNGTSRVSTNLCYFNQVKFPASVTSIDLGFTAFEKTTSTLLFCGGTQVNLNFKLKRPIQILKRFYVPW